MLPSRGLGWSRQTIASSRCRLEPYSARYYSSIAQNARIRSNPLLSKNGILSPRTYTGNQIPRLAPLIRNGPSIRFASTTPVSAAAAASSPFASSPPQDVSSSVVTPGEFVPSSLDSAADFSTSSLYDIPEHIGYLKSLGLDFGWGPTAVVEWILEHIHVYAGTPWWVSISLTVIAFRAVLFKPYISASDNGARMIAVKPITDPLNKQMMAARGDTTAVLQLRAEIQAINRKAGIKVWKSLVPMTQLFFGYGMFVLLRAMAKLPVPGLETGGALWFQDLTLPDPYLILPAATALALHWVLRRGGELSASNMSPNAMKVMATVLPAVSFVVTCFLPAAVQVSFLVSGLLSLAQASLFRIRAFRSFFNMYPLVTRNTEKPVPYKGVMKVRSPLTQDEINRTYQESRVPTTATPEFETKQEALHAVKPPGQENMVKRFVTGTVQGAVKDIRSTVKDATEGAKAMVGKGKENMEQRQAKSGQASAAAYEEKRQKEIRQEKYEREQERRSRQLAKWSKTNTRS